MLQIDKITASPKLRAIKSPTVNDDPVNEVLETEDGKKASSRRSQLLARKSLHMYRRAFSETQLLDLLTPMELKKGMAYHFITGGDIDSLSYLKLILRAQDLDYCLFSTWCMAQEDIFQFRDWIEAGKIKKLDAYVGEIFPGSYRMEYSLLKKVITPDIGRIAVFRNHSKIFAGTGSSFSFGIETSANVNTNPRTENACITIDDDIFEFYKSYFDGIKSFD